MSGRRRRRIRRAWVVAPALGAALLPGHEAVGPSPAPSPETAWYLTTAQLARVVAGTATSDENIGKTVIADVQITNLPHCPPIRAPVNTRPSSRARGRHIPVLNAQRPRLDGLVRDDHPPEVDGASAGFEGLVVAEGLNGGRHVWVVH